MENYKSVPLKVITEELQITDAPIKALVKRDYSQKSMWKCTEIRMTMTILNKRNHSHLLRNKSKLLHRFYHQLQMKLTIHFTIWCYRKRKNRSIFTIYSSGARERKKAIVLVPEIALTPQMVDRFKGRFGSQVAVLHSALSVGEKYDEWRKILRKEVKVVVGARSAVFAPFENLGIIIIDEEHESSYKQEDNPRYHARDVAVWRGQYHKCPIVLGSATPTLESFARAKKVCMNY